MRSIRFNYPDVLFIIKCALSGGMIMFICMAVGELWVDQQLFGAFLNRPAIWPFIFIESALWLIPCMVVMLPLLKRVKNLAKNRGLMVIAGTWITVGIIIIIGYKQTYYPGDWNWGRLLRPDITFGWTLPCALIFALYIVFSVQHLRRI